jgi:cysteine desulfurase
MIYLDYAATTPITPLVKEGIYLFLNSGPANASSVHQAGQAAHHILSKARSQLASIIHSKEKEIIFTSGGTEANNLAILGFAQSQSHDKTQHFITSKIEHASVLSAFEYLESLGHEVTYLSPQSSGCITPDSVAKAIQKNTALVSIMWTNNEIGNNNPIHEIAQLCSDKNIIFHCDAVQALGYEDFQFDHLNIDMLSISSHKIYGPSGIGALIVKTRVPLKPLIFGGHQNWNLRGGTENLLGIHGFQIALTELESHRLEDKEHSERLFIHALGLLKNNPKICINTNLENRSNHILNFTIKNIDGESLFMRLDMLGFAVSNGAACSSGAQKPSHVLKALGKSDEEAQSSIRMSWGRFSTIDEINSFAKALQNIID